MLVQLLNYFEMSIPISFQEKSKEINEKNAESIINIEYSHGSKVFQVQFEYEAEIVNGVKNLHPEQKSYDMNEKIWNCSTNSFSEFIEIMKDLQYKPESELKFEEFKKEIESTKEDEKLEIKIDTEEKSNFEIKVDEKDKFQFFQFTVTDTKTEEFKPFKTQFSSFIDISSDDDSWTSDDDNSKPSNYCTCGYPENVTNGVHFCRFYGFYKCFCCGHTWTSGYCSN